MAQNPQNAPRAAFACHAYFTLITLARGRPISRSRLQLDFQIKKSNPSPAGVLASSLFYRCNLFLASAPRSATDSAPAVPVSFLYLEARAGGVFPISFLSICPESRARGDGLIRKRLENQARGRKPRTRACFFYVAEIRALDPEPRPRTGVLLKPAL